MEALSKSMTRSGPPAMLRLGIFTFACQVLPLFMVILASPGALSALEPNEVDVLPSARQYTDPGWLPTDWYLNLDVPYRRAFNLIAGPVIRALGFRAAAITLRLTIYAFLAVAFCTLTRALKLRFSLAVLTVALFLSHQSIVAGEWIAGGADTKSIAYGCVILACAGFATRRYRGAFAALGAALSFHVLIGVYATFCAGVVLLANLRSCRAELGALFRSCWTFLPTGILGLHLLAGHLWSSGHSEAGRAWEIYVRDRLPHHLLPGAWDPGWITALGLSTLILLAVFFLARPATLRLTASCALASMLLFGLGLGIHAFGPIQLLRFYWFRFPDVIVPLSGAVVMALVLNALSRGEPLWRGPVAGAWHRPRPLLSRVLAVLLGVAATGVILWSSFRIHAAILRPGAPRPPIFTWIHANTPKHAVFLVDPTLDWFYVATERSMFVSLKHMPQAPPHILEWYERIRLATGGLPPCNLSHGSRGEISSRFHGLGAAEVKRITDSYRIDYYLSGPDQSMPLPFKVVRQTADFTLFSVYR